MVWAAGLGEGFPQRARDAGPISVRASPARHEQKPTRRPTGKQVLQAARRSLGRDDAVGDPPVPAVD